MDNFILLAAAAGCGIGVFAAPIGCLIVWRKMSYFGAALSHAALLGVAIGIMLKIDLKVSMFLVSLLTGFALYLMMRNPRLSTDTLLGILAHGSLALGMMLMSFATEVRVDLMAYLFGDVLAVTNGDLVWIGVCGLIVLATTGLLWRRLLTVTIHPDLARVDGEAVDWINIIFLATISIVIAVSMQIVGLMLIVSLLIIPAATARNFATSPESMVLAATLVSIASVLIGLTLSLFVDTPAGPSIVTVALVIFVVTHTRSMMAKPTSVSS